MVRSLWDVVVATLPVADLTVVTSRLEVAVNIVDVLTLLVVSLSVLVYLSPVVLDTAAAPAVVVFSWLV